MSDQNPNRMERDALVSEVDRLRALGDALAESAEWIGRACPGEFPALEDKAQAWRAR